MPRKKRGYFQYGDYRRSQSDDISVQKSRSVEEKEVLTGTVANLPASDLEERFARGLSKNRVPYQFQFEFYTPYTAQKNTVDFVTRGVQPIEIDGFVGHYMTIGRKAETFTRDLFVNEAMERMGMGRVLHIPYWKLDDQDKADRAPREYKL